MRTDIISFIAPENRKLIIRTILKYPNRQFTSSLIEDLTKISHPTVFRTLKGLKEFNILKTIKLDKKTIIYELAKDSILTKEIKRTLNIQQTEIKEIAKQLTNKIKSKETHSIILYGSSKKQINKDSDIDILIILKKPNKLLEQEIQNTLSILSSKFNKTIHSIFLTLKETKKQTIFIKTVKSDMEILYGENPF